MCMDIASPLEVLLRGAVKYIKICMAMTIPAIPLLPALDIQGYQIHFYIISLCLYIMVAESKTLTLVPWQFTAMCKIIET